MRHHALALLLLVGCTLEVEIVGPSGPPDAAVDLTIDAAIVPDAAMGPSDADVPDATIDSGIDASR